MPSRLRPALTFAAVLSLSIGFAACGDDGDETTVTETEVVESTSDATETEDVTEAPPEPQPPAAPGTEGPEFFATPTGNIGCSVSPQGTRCDIAKRSWKPTPPPEPCELDYGNGISLGTDGAQFTCAGDTALGAPDVLGYGERSQRGVFFCDSAEAGVTCSNLETGAGFFISRESYRTF